MKLTPIMLVFCPQSEQNTNIMGKFLCRNLLNCSIDERLRKGSSLGKRIQSFITAILFLPVKDMPLKIKALTRFVVVAIATLPLFSHGNGMGAIARTPAENIAQGRPVTTEALFVTHLFDASGRETAQIPGLFERFSPNGQVVVINHSPASGHFYLFDTTGRKLSEIETFRLTFSPDSQRIVTESALYDSTGRQLADLSQTRISGEPIFSPDGQRFVLFGEESAYLFDASEERIAEIPGRFSNAGSGFSATGQRTILHELGRQARCHLLDSYGRAITVFLEGCEGTTPNGQYFFLGVGTPDKPSLSLYNFSGQEVAQLLGTLALLGIGCKLYHALPILP